MDLRSSYDAEVYAVLLACEAILWLQSNFKWKLTSIKIYIDNKSVIRTLEYIKHKKRLDPMMAEYEKWSKIQALIDQTKSRVVIYWQKSHTNETTIPSQLNDLADQLADITYQISNSNEIFRHVTNQYSSADLRWNNIPITSNIFTTIQCLKSRQIMKNYMCQKFKWSRQTYSQIQWTAREQSLKTRSPSRNTQIHKIIYNWESLNK